MNTMMEQPPPSPVPATLEPKAIKPFGIIHIVFGSLGLLQVIGGLVMQIFQKAMLEMSSSGDEEMVQLQIEMGARLKGFTYVTYGIQLILAVLILWAGLSLVKKKKNAIKNSNIWAYSSLAAKAILMILTFTLVMPIYNEMFDKMLDPDQPGAASTLKVMKTTAAVGGVVGPLIMCIYPIISLVLLNKKQNQEFLQQYGT